MALTKLRIGELSRKPGFWLGGVAGTVVLLHLMLVMKSGKVGLLGMSIVSWLAVANLVVNKVHHLDLTSSLASSLWGTCLLGMVLLPRSHFMDDGFLRLSPFFTGLALSLLASGLRGLKQFQSELLVLFFLGVPRMILPSVLDISGLTAGVAGFMLHYFGYQVSVNGVHISLPSGQVNVGGGCDGMEAITHLSSLAVIFLVTFPASPARKIQVLIVALFCAFISNAIRVAVLAVVVSSTGQRAFDYWHQGRGSLIWMAIPVSAFGLFCLFLVRQDERGGTPQAIIEA